MDFLRRFFGSPAQIQYARRNRLAREYPMVQRTVLLIQIRHRSDPSAAHEAACLRRRLANHDVQWVVRNALEDTPSVDWLSGVDMVFIGGSGYHSMVRHGNDPWVGPLRHLLDNILNRQLPGMGLCFGHQLVGHHLGADVSDDPAQAEIGTVQLHLTDDATQTPLMATMPHTFSGQTGHSDHVVSTPDDVVLLASNDALATQAFQIKGTAFYTTQFHPELSGSEARERYQLVSSGLAKTNDDALPEAVNLFKTGQDDTLDLIERLTRQTVEG